jgi:hypothetical protein
MFQTQLLNREFLYTDAGLAMVFEAIDDLHDAASEGQITRLTALDKQELVGWLQELIFTAQETITELEARAAHSARQEPVLYLVK